MWQRVWAWLRLGAGVAILAVLVTRLGTGPFLAGLRTVDVASLAAGALICLVTTWCAAWRWRIVAGRLHVGMPLATAIAASYRAQFLNSALPAGVLGDVHRAVRHGRSVGDVGRAARSVVWERTAGQVVQIALALIVLVVLPSPVRPAMVVVVPAIALLAIVVGLALRARPPRGTSRAARIVRTSHDDVRTALAAARTWPAIVALSTVVVAGHTATFVIAARTAGSAAPIGQLVPLAVVVLLAMSVPTNIGGWGPREGAAAWLFAAAGLGAAQGLAAATVYGVLVLAAASPGAVVFLFDRRHRKGDADRADDTPGVGTVAAGARVPEGALHG